MVCMVCMVGSLVGAGYGERPIQSPTKPGRLDPDPELSFFI